MFIVIEFSRFNNQISDIINIIEKDFKEYFPNGIISNSSEMEKYDDEYVLILLDSPFRLVDGMFQSKEKAEFYYSCSKFLRNEKHHLVILISDIKIMSGRLRRMVNIRGKIGSSSLFVMNFNAGSRRLRIIPGRDNIWKSILDKDFVSSVVYAGTNDLEDEEDISNKILVTIKSNGNREDYLIKPEEPYVIGDGRTIILSTDESANLIM